MVSLEKNNMIKNLNLVFTLIYGKKPNIVRRCLEKNKIICDSFGVPFKVINFNISGRFEKCQIGTVSDYLRLKYASGNSCVWYVDWDIEIINFPDFSKDTPCFAQITPGNPGFKGDSDTYDIFSFYNGEKTNLFKEFIDFCGPPDFWSPYFKNFNTFWSNKKFSSIRDDGTYFHHHGIKQCFKLAKDKIAEDMQNEK